VLFKNRRGERKLLVDLVSMIKKKKSQFWFQHVPLNKRNSIVIFFFHHDKSKLGKFFDTS
jgi:hypothetical protein